MPLRFDSGTIGTLRRMPHGGVVVPAFIARTGVQTYRTKDGTIVRELRLPEDVFDAESLASLEHAPVTDRHPPELVTPANHRTYGRGHVASKPSVERELVSADLGIADAELIAKIERGDAHETSAGYTCKHEMTSGTYNGEAYDCIQREIRYNHVAVGPKGWNRAGREVALRMDDAAVDIDSRGPAPRTAGENPVKKLPKIQITGAGQKRVMRLDDVTYPLRTRDERDLARNACDSAMRKAREGMRLDAMDPAAAQAALSEIMGTFETLQAQIMALVDTAPVEDEAAAPAVEEKPAVVQDTGAAPAKEEPKMDAAEIDRRVNARLAVITRVKDLAPSVKADGKSDHELMLETIKTVDSTFKMDAADEKDAAFVRGVFLGLRPVNKSLARAQAIAGGERTDADDVDPVAAARTKARNALESAWKSKA